MNKFQYCQDTKKKKKMLWVSPVLPFDLVPRQHLLELTCVTEQQLVTNQRCPGSFSACNFPACGYRVGWPQVMEVTGWGGRKSRKLPFLFCKNSSVAACSSSESSPSKSNPGFLPVPLAGMMVSCCAWAPQGLTGPRSNSGAHIEWLPQPETKQNVDQT